MDIKQEVETQLQKVIDNGTLSTIIEKQITATCTSLVTDMFRDYSEFGKELKKTLQEKLKINLNELNIPAYTLVVCRAIEEATDGVLEQVKGQVKKHVSDVLELPEKQDWKLSEIVKIYRGLEDDHDADELIVEVEDSSYSSHWVKIGKKVSKTYSWESTRDQEYEIRMLIDSKTKVLHNVWYKENMINPRKNKVYKHDIEMLLAKLWMNECTIELDEDDAQYEGSKSVYED